MSKLLDQVSILRNKSPIIPQTKNPATGQGLDALDAVNRYFFLDVEYPFYSLILLQHQLKNKN